MKSTREFYHERAKATIISAYKLSQSELDLIKEKIPALKRVELVNVIDKGIIGGIIIQHGSKVIDFSLKNRLEKLRNIMYENL